MRIEDYLLNLCDEVYRAEYRAQAERKREIFGDQWFTELVIMRKDKVKVEIRKENVNHNAPHIHITHSDKIDVSISLLDFSILAGKIDKKTQRHLFSLLIPLKDDLLPIWTELNEKENCISAEKMIEKLSV